jgi:hypothetical protein
MALFQILRMIRGIAHVDFDCLVPAVNDFDEMRVKRARHRFRQRISPILVFAAGEAVTRHHGPAPKQLVLIIKSANTAALFGEKNTLFYRASVGVASERLSIGSRSFTICAQSRDSTPAHNACRADFRCCGCRLRDSHERTTTAVLPFCIDEEILKAEGTTNFDKYAVNPEIETIPDLFVD